MAVKTLRDGFHTVTPYLFAAGADRLIDSVASALDGEVLSWEERPEGTVMHAESRVGGLMIMIGEAPDEFGPMPSSIYLYVADCDAALPTPPRGGRGLKHELGTRRDRFRSGRPPPPGASGIKAVQTPSNRPDE